MIERATAFEYAPEFSVRTLTPLAELKGEPELLRQLQRIRENTD